MIDQLLHQKIVLEAEMQDSPGDTTLREKYFITLDTISRSYFGSFFAVLPEIKTPVLFRGGTSDFWNLKQVFLNKEYEAVTSEPRRILDIGAYVGYTAIFFANRYPASEIISIEPPGVNFDTLRINTISYPNIKCIDAAIWRERAELILSDIPFGDWGTWFKEGSETVPLADTGPQQRVQGYRISDILEMVGWGWVDLIKCSGHGGQVWALLQPRPHWFENVLTIITRPGARGWQEGDAEELEAVLPNAEFERKDGPVAIFSRRAVAIEPYARVMRVLPNPPFQRGFTVSNVNDELDFFKFGYSGIQLTANPPGSPMASLSTQLPLEGHSRFRVKLATGDGSTGRGGIGELLPEDQSLIWFHVQLLDADSGRIALDANHTLPVNAVLDWVVDFSPTWGMHKVVLSTGLVPPEGLVMDLGRPSYFIDPCFM